MKPVKLILLLALLLPAALFAQTDTFPDGKPVPAWFSESGKVDVSALGPQYVVTRYGVKRDSTRVQTAATPKRSTTCFGSRCVRTRRSAMNT